MILFFCLNLFPVYFFKPHSWVLNVWIYWLAPRDISWWWISVWGRNSRKFYKITTVNFTSIEKQTLLVRRRLATQKTNSIVICLKMTQICSCLKKTPSQIKDPEERRLHSARSWLLPRWSNIQIKTQAHKNAGVSPSSRPWVLSTQPLPPFQPPPSKATITLSDLWPPAARDQSGAAFSGDSWCSGSLRCLTARRVFPSFSGGCRNSRAFLPSFLPLFWLLLVARWQLSNGLSRGPSGNWKSVIAGRRWSRHLWVWVVGWVLRRWAGRSRVTWEPDSLPRGAVNTS